MIKAVNDTNVWVAGIHWNRGAGYLIRQRWAAGEFEHLTSGAILYEIIRVLREIFHYPDELLYQWYWLIITGSTYVIPKTIVNTVKDDPDDNKLLACALDGGADYLVTEDKDLHRLHNYPHVQLVNKQQFLRILENLADPHHPN